MTRDAFWQIIEGCRPSNGDLTEHIDAIRQTLSAMPVPEIVSFQRQLDEVMGESYNADLWMVMYIIEGGCGDDAFDYYRGWLILQGPKTFGVVVNDPERLVDFLEDGGVGCAEDFLGVALVAHKQKTGDSNLPYHEPLEPELKGELLDEAGKRKRFPKLFERFWDRS